MSVSQDTNQSRAIILKYLSPSWVEQLDEQAGKALAENGMNFQLEASFEGQARPKWYKIILLFLPWKKRIVN